jgi:hypothetical protein
MTWDQSGKCLFVYLTCGNILVLNVESDQLVLDLDKAKFFDQDYIDMCKRTGRLRSMDTIVKKQEQEEIDDAESEFFIRFYGVASSPNGLYHVVHCM